MINLANPISVYSPNDAGITCTCSLSISYQVLVKLSGLLGLWLDPEFKRAHICTQGNLLLTFDGETSELKGAKVLK